MVFDECAGVRSYVDGGYNKGLSTQPCGEPVLRVMDEERWGSVLTLCGRSVGKSLIQLYVNVDRPRSNSFPTRMLGMIVLKAEVKSIKSILTSSLGVQDRGRRKGNVP